MLGFCNSYGRLSLQKKKSKSLINESDDFVGIYINRSRSITLASCDIAG